MNEWREESEAQNEVVEHRLREEGLVCFQTFFMNHCLHALSPHCILFIALCSCGCLRNNVKVLYIHCACGFSRGSCLIAFYFFIVDQKYSPPPLLLEMEILVVISKTLRAHIIGRI